MGSFYICSALPCGLPGLPNDFCQVCKANCEATYHLMDLTGMVAKKINLFQLKKYLLRCVFCSPLHTLTRIYMVLKHVKTTEGGGADSQVAQKDYGRCCWKQCLPTWRSGDDQCGRHHVISIRPCFFLSSLFIRNSLSSVMINMIIIIIIFINLFHHPFFNGFHSVSLFFLCMSCLFTSFYPCPGPAGALLRIVQAVLSAQQWFHRVIRLHLRRSAMPVRQEPWHHGDRFDQCLQCQPGLQNAHGNYNGIIGIRRKVCSLSLRSRWSRF